jgi:hypothetical protein
MQYGKTIATEEIPMTEDEKDAALLSFMNRLAGAAEKVATAFEVRCQAAAAKDVAESAIRAKSLAHLEDLMPKLAALLNPPIKLDPKTEKEPSP